jgi:superfamily II DNA or RNA helicase
MLRTLRPDQQKAIDDLRAAIARGERRIILQAPTGFGKTVLASAIIERALERGKRVLFTVPALSLIDQAVEAFREEGITDVGVIQGQHEMTNWGMPIQVASVQTLMRRKIPQADVVMVDEAHRWFKFYGQWFLHPEWLQIPIIGLSATPWTKGLGAYYKRLIIAGTTEALIESAHLAPFKVYAPSHPDLTGVRTVAGDYHEGELSEVMSGGGLTADIVDTWLRLGEQRSTFCFAVDRAHAKALQLKFEDRGIPTAYMDAHTPREEREEIRQRFHAGEIKIVCNVGVLTTGIDWDVRCLVLARPTKSEILFVQIVGRALRTAEGKDHALILDHSDNHLRLAFTTKALEKLVEGATMLVEEMHSLEARASIAPAAKEAA